MRTEKILLQGCAGIIAAAVVVLLAAAPAAGQRGFITEPMNLAQLVDRAAVIVRGNVVEARVEKHPELSSIWMLVITVRVQEALKGAPGSTYVYRQFLWDARDRADAAGYKQGGEVLLLLTPPSEYGLSAPVGMQQGRFLLTTDALGAKQAVNGAGNAGLFRDLQADLMRKGVEVSARVAAMVARPQAGPVAWDDLRALIQSLVRD